MFTGIIESLIIHLLIPEVARVLRKNPDATDADIIVELELRKQRIAEKGLAFLARTAPDAPADGH